MTRPNDIIILRVYNIEITVFVVDIKMLNIIICVKMFAKRIITRSKISNNLEEME